MDVDTTKFPSKSLSKLKLEISKLWLSVSYTGNTSLGALWRTVAVPIATGKRSPGFENIIQHSSNPILFYEERNTMGPIML